MCRWDGGVHIALLRGQNLTSATLCKTKQDDSYIHLTVAIDSPPTSKTPQVIGVDLGPRDLATNSTGESGSDREIQTVRDQYSKAIANIQSKRTQAARRLLRRLSGREKRFQEWLNHNISKKLFQDAKELNAALDFEALIKIGESLNTSQTERGKTNNWAFDQLRLFVNYKSAIAINFG